MVDDIGTLARDIVKTIEREDAFDRIKKEGGFLKRFKAKNIKEFLNEAWNNY